MDKVLSSVQEYIKSGEYFVDARRWYNYQYLYPLVQRSFLLIICSIFFTLLLCVATNFETLLPIVRQVRYAIVSGALKNATIIKANYIKNNPIQSVADIMIRNYLMHRESYNYNLLQNQFKFIQNNSTRIVFRQFANFMNIDNPISPVIRYQKSLKRSINILSVDYNNSEVKVIFTSLVKGDAQEILENMKWQAIIDYKIDEIDINLPSNSKFNFTVNGYSIKLLEDLNTK